MRLSHLVLALLPTVACTQAGSNEIDFLGQQPPGREVTLFAPGTVSSDYREHGVPVFSTDGNEVLFVRQYENRHDILWSRRTDEGWSNPTAVPFSSGALDDGPSFFPIDGRLFYGSRRAAELGGESLEQTDIWCVLRDGDGWGIPVLLGPPINTVASEGYPSFTSSGTMYFHSERGGDSTLADIYRADWSGQNFGEPERLPEPVNSGLYEAGPFVAPDESYVIYMQVNFAEPQSTSLNLSFRTDSGAWTDPIDLASELNLPRTDLLLGRVSPDGRYLFLLAGGDVYWMDARVIEELRER